MTWQLKTDFLKIKFSDFPNLQNFERKIGCFRCFYISGYYFIQWFYEYSSSNFNSLIFEATQCLLNLFLYAAV